jgi:hypothetical protein
MKRLALGLLVCAALAATGSARADDASDFREAVQAIEQGAYGAAIDRLELLADRGFVHPDASFDRAVAYLGRARSTQKQTGDFGRAAAALAETLVLRPGDQQAETALEAVRSELSRARARKGGAPLFARPRLARAIVSLAPERVWGGLALLGSLVLSVGLALRLLVRREATVVPGSLSIGVGCLLLLVGGTLLAGAREFRSTSTPAVVVAPEARFLDEAGRPLPGTGAGDASAAPEGAELYVLEHRGGLARVEWGSSEAWVVAGQLRELTRP